MIHTIENIVLFTKYHGVKKRVEKTDSPHLPSKKDADLFDQRVGVVMRRWFVEDGRFHPDLRGQENS